MKLVTILCIFVHCINPVHSEFSGFVQSGYKNLIWNKLLEGSLIERVFDISVLECVRKCIITSRCKSINYSRSYLVCELNYRTDKDTGVILKDKYRFVYTDIQYWNKETVGLPRSNITCQDGMRCNKSRVNSPCQISDCNKPPHLNGAVAEGEGISIGSHRVYTCENTKVKHISVCQENGNWSNVDFECKDLENCQEVKDCNRDYSDGEYWLYPKANNYTKTKIYCHNMTYQPLEYVTLYGINEAKINKSISTANNPCAWRLGVFTRSVFSKIRLDITRMAVVRSDKTFADLTVDPTNTWDPPDFAYGLGCAIHNLGSCMKIGYFRIDTSNTGLKVSSNVNYTLKGYYPVWGPIFKSANGHLTEVRCDGACGYCLPDGELILVNADDKAASDSATYPQCKRNRM